MTRLSIFVVLLAVMMAAPATGLARVSGPEGRKVRAARQVKKHVKRHKVRVGVREARVRKLARKRPSLANKSAARQKARKRATIKRTTKRARNRVVKLSLKRFTRQERRAMMALMNSKRVRSTRAAQQLVAEFIRLRSVSPGGKGMPLSIKALKTMTESSRWTSTRMGNLARVLRLARHIAKRDGVSIDKAFGKALKAAGVYKKYNSGRCKA